MLFPHSPERRGFGPWQADRSWEHRNSSLVFHIPHRGWQRGNSPCLVYSGCLGARPRISRLFRLPRLDDTNIFSLARTLTLCFQILVVLFFFYFVKRVRKLHIMVNRAYCATVDWKRLESTVCICSGVAGFPNCQFDQQMEKRRFSRLSAQGANINSLTAILNSV